MKELNRTGRPIDDFNVILDYFKERM